MNEDDGENESLPTADTNNTLKGEGHDQENSSNDNETTSGSKLPGISSSQKKLNGIKSPVNGSKPELGVPFNIKKS